MLGRLRMDVDEAIKHYDKIAKRVFSDPKRWGGDGKFKAGKLEEVIKSIVEHQENPIILKPLKGPYLLV